MGWAKDMGDTTRDTRDTDSVIPAEVRDLIEESQKIQGWVERLADHADDVRPEVYEKVLTDYRQRLDAVTGELSEHHAHLVETLDGRRSEVEVLERDHDEHAAELEEVRLRHAVGEFDDDEWEERRGEVQGSLDELDQLLDDERKTVAELEEIIASIGAAGSAGPALMRDAPGPDAGESARTAVRADGEDLRPGVDSRESGEGAEEAGADADAAAAATETAEGGTAAVAADRAKSRKSKEGGPATSKPEKAADEAEGADEDAGEYLDELEFLESLSLGESERFDAVSAMLDEEEGGEKSE